MDSSGSCRLITRTIGIGRASAIALSKAGWSIVLFARRINDLNETKSQCIDSEKVHVVQGNVTDEEDVAKLFQTTISHFGMV